MSTIDYTRSEDEGRTYRVTWTELGNGDDGAPIKVPGAADRAVQVTGTFGAGGTVVLQGSLQAVPVNWVVLTDFQGNALSFTEAGLSPVAEQIIHFRPVVTAGDGNTDVDVTVVSRSTR